MVEGNNSGDAAHVGFAPVSVEQGECHMSCGKHAMEGKVIPLGHRVAEDAFPMCGNRSALGVPRLSPKDGPACRGREASGRLAAVRPSIPLPVSSASPADDG